MLTAVGVVVFLTALLAMFPWLAYVEERTFREGLEEAGLAEELWTALKFGLLHLIMLIPVGAALAIGVAGFAYGRIYRRAFARSREQARTEAGPFGVPVVVGPTVREARNEAVLTSTVWHATFNSLIVLTLLVSFVAGWLLAGARSVPGRPGLCGAFCGDRGPRAPTHRRRGPPAGTTVRRGVGAGSRAPPRCRGRRGRGRGCARPRGAPCAPRTAPRPGRGRAGTR
jgi:hypothetical protein